MAHNILERRRTAVVEVRCTRGQRAQRRRLEAAQVFPKSGDVARSSVRELALFAGRPVAEGVKRQVGRARRRRRSLGVEQSVVDIGAVIRRVVAGVAASAAGIDTIEQLLAPRDLPAARNWRIGPGIEQVEAPLRLCHL